MEALKACPFCGKRPKLKKSTRPGSEQAVVTCGDWACYGSPTSTKGTASVTVARWNTRPVEDALRAELEQLEIAFGLYVYHTTDGKLSKPYDVQMLNAMHDDAVTAFVEEETAKVRAENAELKRKVELACAILGDLMEAQPGGTYFQQWKKKINDALRDAGEVAR